MGVRGQPRSCGTVAPCCEVLAARRRSGDLRQQGGSRRALALVFHEERLLDLVAIPVPLAAKALRLGKEAGGDPSGEGPSADLQVLGQGRGGVEVWSHVSLGHVVREADEVLRRLKCSDNFNHGSIVSGVVF